MENITGLTLSEVSKKQSLGLSNQTIDSYSPSTFIIIQRNLFSLINIVCIPLLIILAIYDQDREILAFATFLIINTLVSILDELRIKGQLDKLKTEFQQTVKVIRESQEYEIPSSEIVHGDIIKAKEGEGIIADGIVKWANYLQVDESALNGESNYIKKDENEEVLSGAYIVTGECVYEVTSVGKNNYLNKLGSEAVTYREVKSPMQQANDKLILFLIIASITLGILNYLFTRTTDLSQADRILSVTSIISLIIPQTLIFLFTLTITISITKLFRRGVLIQKGGSIDELSEITHICFDKTGTITTNEMKIVDVEYINTNEETIGEFYNSISHKIVGVNKTQELLNKYYSKFEKEEVEDFYQIPFNSKNKFSLVSDDENQLIFGAFSYIKSGIDDSLVDKIENKISKLEDEGNRVLVGIYFKKSENQPEQSRRAGILDKSRIDYAFDEIVQTKTSSIVIYTIEETLNPGIKDIFSRLRDQGIEIKIISGDSKVSVSRVLQKIGYDTSKVVDISQTDQSLNILVENYSVFTRAKPEQKLDIIKLLKANGHKVAMVGDGINDVLSLKAADVSIAMEGGSKITREVSDIVLLENDYSKIPEIFYEGENIIYNLKLTSKLFLMKSFNAIFMAIFFTLSYLRFPIDPSSTLIFSFLGSSAPSYLLIFTRQKVRDKTSFFRDVILDSVPAAFLFSIAMIYLYFNNQNMGREEANTSLVLLALPLSVIYSIYLIWKSGKLNNIFLAAFLYLVINIVGICQTLFPIVQPGRSRDDIIFLFGLTIAGALILMFSILAGLQVKTWSRKLLVILGCLIAVPIIAAFPFAEWYSIQSISINNIISNQVIVFITFGIFVVVDYVINKLFRK